MLGLNQKSHPKRTWQERDAGWKNGAEGAGGGAEKARGFGTLLSYADAPGQERRQMDGKGDF